MSPLSSNTPRAFKANERGLRQQHDENIAQGFLKNGGMVSDHRSTQETGTSSSNDVSDKRAKQALGDARMVSWLNTPQAYEYGESEKHRQARVMADFTHTKQVGLGRNGIAIDVREGDDKDETLSGAQGAPAGLEGVGAWAGHVKK